MDIQHNTFIYVLRIISVIFFFFEIFLRFNIGIYYKGHIVMNSLKITVQYAKKYLLLDIIGVISLILGFKFYDFNLENSIINSIFYIKLFSLNKVKTNMKKRHHLHYEESHTLKLL